MSGSILHIAGLPTQVGTNFRQRCAWCGALLLEYGYANTMAPPGQDGNLPAWVPFTLLRVDGNATYVVRHMDGDEIPPDSCAALDPAVTV